MYIGIDEIGAMRHKVVRIVHVTTLLDAHEMFGRVEATFAASAGQKFFHRHIVF